MPEGTYQTGKYNKGQKPLSPSLQVEIQENSNPCKNIGTNKDGKTVTVKPLNDCGNLNGFVKYFIKKELE